VLKLKDKDTTKYNSRELCVKVRQNREFGAANKKRIGKMEAKRAGICSAAGYEMEFISKQRHLNHF